VGEVIGRRTAGTLPSAYGGDSASIPGKRENIVFQGHVRGIDITGDKSDPRGRGCDAVRQGFERWVRDAGRTGIVRDQVLGKVNEGALAESRAPVLDQLVRHLLRI
jgi:hypothetical protein